MFRDVSCASSLVVLTRAHCCRCYIRAHVVATRRPLAFVGKQVYCFLRIVTDRRLVLRAFASVDERRRVYGFEVTQVLCLLVHVVSFSLAVREILQCKSPDGACFPFQTRSYGSL